MRFEADYAVEDTAIRRPKLHLKAQVFLNRAAIDSLNHVQWDEVNERYFIERARQVQEGNDYGDIREEMKDFNRVLEQTLDEAVAAAGLEDSNREFGYLAVGSHNMDYRGMMMDGEVLYLTSGRGIITGLLDLLMIAAISTWVDDLEELEALVPAYSEWQRRVGRFIKYAL
jgi:hypothetical protein